MIYVGWKTAYIELLEKFYLLCTWPKTMYFESYINLLGDFI